MPNNPITLSVVTREQFSTSVVNYPIKMNGRAVERDDPRYKVETVSSVYADACSQFGPDWDDVEHYQLPNNSMAPYELIDWIGSGKYGEVFTAHRIPDDELLAILADPGAFIESRDYFSWERFFFATLSAMTKGTRLQYGKGSMSGEWLSDGALFEVAAVIPATGL